MAQQHPYSPAATINSLSDDDKHIVLSYLPHDIKVIAVAPARIYHSPFGAAADAWTSTGLRGMLVFGRNRITVHADRPLGVGEGASIEQNYWFRLIDVENGKGIVWFHPIPSEMDYHSDKPFFHTFSGCSRMFGFRFDEDSDAEKFRRRITSRVQITASRLAKSRTIPKRVPSPSPHRSPSTLPPAYTLTDDNAPTCRLTTPASTRVPQQSQPQPQQQQQSQPRRLSPSMISAPSPGTFVHVAHVGIDADGHIESTPNVEPGWTMILEELQGYGVTEKMVREDFDFVEGFLAGAKASLVKELERTPTPVPPANANAKVRRAQTLGGSANDGERRARLVQRKRVPQAGHF